MKSLRDLIASFVPEELPQNVWNIALSAWFNLSKRVTAVCERHTYCAAFLLLKKLHSKYRASVDPILIYYNLASRVWISNEKHLGLNSGSATIAPRIIDEKCLFLPGMDFQGGDFAVHHDIWSDEFCCDLCKLEGPSTYCYLKDQCTLFHANNVVR